VVVQAPHRPLKLLGLRDEFSVNGSDCHDLPSMPRNGD
jgi:hypothetical protein